MFAILSASFTEDQKVENMYQPMHAESAAHATEILTKRIGCAPPAITDEDDSVEFTNKGVHFVIIKMSILHKLDEYLNG